jgi:hypothetical protein
MSDVLSGAAIALLSFGVFGALLAWILRPPAVLPANRRRTRRVIAASLAAVDELAWRYTEPRMRAIVARGGSVVDALGRFEAETGRSPKSLGELVPRYLDAWPLAEPEKGSRFWSWTFGEGQWALGASLDGDEAVHYSPRPLPQERRGNPSRRFGDRVWVKES